MFFFVYFILFILGVCFVLREEKNTLKENLLIIHQGCGVYSDHNREFQLLTFVVIGKFCLFCGLIALGDCNESLKMPVRPPT